jgi:hypothetical protein
MTIAYNLFLARIKDRNNIPIANRSSTGKAYSLHNTMGEMTRKRRKEEFLSESGVPRRVSLHAKDRSCRRFNLSVTTSVMIKIGGESYGGEIKQNRI